MLILIKPVYLLVRLFVYLFATFNHLTYLPVQLFASSTVLKLFTYNESIHTIYEACPLASMATCGSHGLLAKNSA